jgi:hypothetical protein
VSQVAELYLKNVKKRVPVVLAAFFTNGIELMLGFSLILQFYTSVTIIITTLLLISFSIGTWYHRKELDNCGCFGALIHRSPAHSITENIIMICMLLLSYYYGNVNSNFVLWKFLVVVDMLFISLFLCTLFLYFPFSYPVVKFSTLRKRNSISKIKYFSEFIGANSEVLIIASSNSCRFCVTQIPFVNGLSKLFRKISNGTTVYLISENEEARLPEWIDSEIKVKYIKNFHHFGLISNGKPASALAENSRIVKTWNYVIPFLWDLYRPGNIENYLEEYFNHVFECYSKYYDFTDYQYLLTILFEQAIKLDNKGIRTIPLRIFDFIANKANRWINVPEDFHAKSYYNLAVTQMKDGEKLSSAESFEKASFYLHKIKSAEKIIESLAIANALNPGSNGQYPPKLIEYSSGYPGIDFKTKYDEEFKKLKGIGSEYQSELKLIDPKDKLE